MCQLGLICKAQQSSTAEKVVIFMFSYKPLYVLKIQKILTYGEINIQLERRFFLIFGSQKPEESLVRLITLFYN